MCILVFALLVKLPLCKIRTQVALFSHANVQWDSLIVVMDNANHVPKTVPPVLTDWGCVCHAMLDFC